MIDHLIPEMERSHVEPSPGIIGAFRCAMCGSSQLQADAVVEEIVYVRLLCLGCGNELILASEEGENATR